MTPDRYRKVRGLFEAAFEQPAEVRTSWLEEACSGDEELRDEVQQMLDADALSGKFIEQPAVVAAAALRASEDMLPQLEGRHIGPYRIQHKIGHGGMAVVYLAERADETFHKQVAFKLLRPGLVNPELVRRFQQEREILAGLDHPNIAHLLDGGTTEEGLPYFVMEYIEGQPIDKYCDEHKFNVTERLRLFQSVCSAVAYAHQHLVVHRDLKPSNILVTVEGRVKLLDFGIAKLLGAQGEEAAYLTRSGIYLLTPEYASPEQVKGETITTVTDVYSLGVILYELLTGHRPYHMKSRLLHEIARIICEEEPTWPSTAVGQVVEVPGRDPESETITPEQVSAVREGKPWRLKKRLSGDLDNVLLLALRKEPQYRYSSVEQLSEDLRRHLVGLPILAQKDTLWYRTRKFVKRNRVGVVTAAGFGTALIAIGASLWRAHEEWMRAAAIEQELTIANRRLGLEPKGSNALAQELVRENPLGWKSSKSPYFEIKLDRTVTRDGKPSLCISAKLNTSQHDGLGQMIRSDSYHGKRVRFSGYVKCNSVKQGAGLWMRVAGKDGILAFDNNMHREPKIVGTKDWEQYAVVLPVSADSTVISFGIQLLGKGEVWFNGLQWDIVGPDVPVTDYWSRIMSKAYKRQVNLALQREMTNQKPELFPTQPVNLDWKY